jgi:hypothetical protein
LVCRKIVGNTPLAAAAWSSAPSCAPASTLRFLRNGGSLSWWCGSAMSERLLAADITRAACPWLLEARRGLNKTRQLCLDGVLRYALNMLPIAVRHLVSTCSRWFSSCQAHIAATTNQLRMLGQARATIAVVDASVSLASSRVLSEVGKMQSKCIRAITREY